MLTLTLAALSELESAGPLRLVTGLPVKWYKQDRDALIEQLTGKHRIERAGRSAQSVTVTEALVTIQPFGSLFSVIYNEAGKIINPEIARGRVGVIDVGMFTTDFIIYDRGRYIEPGSGSVTTAMSRVYELASAKIERSFDRPVSLYETDRAIRQGYVSVRGRKRPLAELVDPILRGVSDEILAAVVNRWSGYESGLDTILVSGGGASAIGPYLSQRFPHLSILPDGATANVIGYYRYGLFKSRRQANGRRKGKQNGKGR
jgi:plasmid segregation protein ParM